MLRARLEGGIKNKAARGELRRGLPVGLIWGEADGEIFFHPDEAVTGVIPAVFGQFAVSGSVGHLAVAARPAAALAAAASCLPARQARRDHLGRAHLPCRAHHADPPGLRWRLRLRPHPRRTLPRRGRRAAQTAPHAAPRPVGGPHPRSPPRVHRLGHLPGQPGPHRRQISARRPASRAPARSGKAPRCCRGWPPAGRAAASWPSSTAARPRRCRTTTARGLLTWLTAGDPGT